MAPDVADELTAWLRLLLTPGIGRAAARQLLTAFGTPQAVFEASSAARQQCLGQDASSPDEAPAALAPTMATLHSWLEAAAERDWVALGDARYPQALLQTADPPLLLYTQGDADTVEQPVPGDRRQPQPYAAGCRERARLRRALGTCRVDHRFGAGAGHRRRRPQRRAGCRRSHDRCGRNRTRSRVPACASRARPPHCRARLDHQRVQPRYRAAGGEFSATQSHHRGLEPGHAGGRGGAGIGLVDHRQAFAGVGTRCVRDPGFDPFAAIARLPCLDQAGRQTGRRRARCARRVALGALGVVGSADGACRVGGRRATRCTVGRDGVRTGRDGSIAGSHRLADGRN